MRKEQRQKVWPWAALAFLIGPIVFSACSLLGLNIAKETTVDPGGQTPTLVFTLAIPTAKATVEASPLPATPSPTAAPTLTVPPTPTPIPEQDPTATPLAGDVPPVRYVVQMGSPRYLRAFTHADLGCQWVGVAGQVFDATGAGAKDVAVMVTGSIDAQAIQRAARTDELSPFGPGGYEIFLTDHLSDTPQKISVQLFNLDDQPLTGPFQIDLPTQCDQNLIVVNFNEGKVTQPLSTEGEVPQQLFIPVISR